jgi:hypothetical protein
MVEIPENNSTGYFWKWSVPQRGSKQIA